MQHTLKSIVLGHLFAAGLCVSGYAEWNPEIVAAAKEYFQGQGHFCAANDIESINNYTQTAIIIQIEVLKMIDNAGIKKEHLLQVREELASVYQNALDIQGQASDILVTLLPTERHSGDGFNSVQTGGIPPREEPDNYIDFFQLKSNSEDFTEFVKAAHLNLCHALELNFEARKIIHDYALPTQCRHHACCL
ncbi:MAG: hypothetical protein LBG98_03690 [Puniceicoccales bacterium]|jgi:hypothetical protein|nr:hypothetical protein [Puniceicoccales bacterium]